MTLKTQLNKNRLYFLLFFAFLYLSFSTGMFTNVIVSNLGMNFMSSFTHFQKDSDNLIFSEILFNRSFDDSNGIIHSLKDNPKFEENSYLFYLNDDYFPYTDYKLYPSQIGLQARLFVFLDNILPFSSPMKASLFYQLSALLTALCIAWMVLWATKQTNLTVGILLCVYYGIIDTWVVQFAKSLYWMPFTWFFPFIIATYLMQKSHSLKKSLLLYTLLMLSIFIKCGVGFEYITTVMVSATIPCFYYGILYGQTLVQMSKQFMKISIAAITGLILSFVAYLVQYGQYLNSFSLAVEYLKMTAFKRIPGNTQYIDMLAQYGTKEETIQVFKDSVNVPFYKVIWIYLTGGYGPIGFGLAVILFIIASLIIYFKSIRSTKVLASTKKMQIALIITLWISILAPFSWFVLATGHSYIHTHINFVLWDIPYMLFGILVSLEAARILLAKTPLRIFEKTNTNSV